MSSDLQSDLELLQINDYVSVITITAVVYDCLLTFEREIEYIWCRSWTWVSTIFVVIRYLGLCYVILMSLGGSTFVPGPIRFHRCTIMFQVANWQWVIFLNAADFVMILRVYAMWNRSKWILWVLLFVFIPQVVYDLGISVFFLISNASVSVTTIQIINFTVCSTSLSKTLSHLDAFSQIPRFVMGTALLVLAVTQTLKQSVNMYKATKQWQPNQYMRLLVRDGIVYFFVIMLFSINSTLGDLTSLGGAQFHLFLDLFSYIMLFPMMPRFIISVRELYDLGLRGRWQGVDTGFGVLSQPNANQNTAVSVIAFAAVAPEQGQVVEGNEDELEATRFEPLGDTPQV